ncbi:hypothetical protein MHK_009824, partial [Candidatus Magnetomorum sp. HK-1]
MENLWPDEVGTTTIVSPVAILREQAELLGEKMKNIVAAEVSSFDSSTDSIIYHFYIVAPTLGNYRYRLFTVSHNVTLYPLEIYVDDELGKEVEAKQEIDDRTGKDYCVITAKT